MAGHTTQYMLVLRAYPDKWASGFSDQVKISAAQDVVAPNPPSNLTVEPVSEALVISWLNPTKNSDDSDCNDLAWVRVYKSTTAAIDITDPETYDSKTLVTGETFTMDTEALYGSARYYQCVISAVDAADVTTVADRGYRGRTQVEYFIVVTAVDRTGNESIASSEESSTPASASESDDPDAIHTGTAAEISAVAVKSVPVSGDYLLIEDSEDDDAKAHVTLGSITTDRYMYVRILEADTDHEIADKVGGDVVLLEAMTVLDVGAFSDAAGTDSVTTIDILENGTTILSTKITIDATEKTSKTADDAPVVSDTALAANGILTFNIDGIASGTAGKGMTVWLKVRF